MKGLPAERLVVRETQRRTLARGRRQDLCDPLGRARTRRTQPASPAAGGGGDARCGAVDRRARRHPGPEFRRRRRRREYRLDRRRPPAAARAGAHGAARQLSDQRPARRRAGTACWRLANIRACVNPPDGQLSTANSRTLLGPGSALLGDGGFDLGARSSQLRDRLRMLGPRTDAAAAFAVALDDRALFIAGAGANVRSRYSTRPACRTSRAAPLSGACWKPAGTAAPMSIRSATGSRAISCGRCTIGCSPASTRNWRRSTRKRRWRWPIRAGRRCSRACSTNSPRRLAAARPAQLARGAAGGDRPRAR